MARSDLLVSLVRAGATGDKKMLTSATEALIAEERAKSHQILADRLQRALQSVSITPPASTSGLSTQSEKEAILETVPRKTLEELILTLPAREQVKALIEEQHRADLLRAHGIQPRHRVLLSGPPGNGKTSIAEALAEGLSVPFFIVRYDALISSFLGETNTRLRKLFDYVRTTPCVLFFDEFDAIGKERGDTHETGEIKRVVSFLLMQIDQLPSYVVTVAATNHAELLDRAVWRRFQIRLSMPAPSQDLIAAYIGRIIGSWPEGLGVDENKIAHALGSVSFAEAADFCMDVRRRYVLSLGERKLPEVIKEQLSLWATRVTPPTDNAKRSNQTSPQARRSRTTAKKPRTTQRRTNSEF